MFNTRVRPDYSVLGVGDNRSLIRPRCGWGKEGKLKGGDNDVMLRVNKMAGFGANDPSNMLL